MSLKIGSTSNGSVAYGSEPELPFCDYSHDPSISPYALDQFVSCRGGPLSERLVAEGTCDNRKQRVEADLERIERCFPEIGNRIDNRTEIHALVKEAADSHESSTHGAGNTACHIPESLLTWLRRSAAGAPLVDGSSGQPGTSGSGYASIVDVPSGESSNFNTAPKRGRKAGKGGGDEDNNEQSKKVKKDSSLAEDQEGLACPFLKYNPSRYGRKRSCSKHTWPNVSRLKSDHIYRYHRVFGVQCPRCGGIISSSTRSKHSNCREQHFDLIEGVDSITMDELHSKSTARNGSEEDKWCAVYGILFPHIPRENYPSPYPTNDSIDLMGDVSQSALSTALYNSLAPLSSNTNQTRDEPSSTLTNLVTQRHSNATSGSLVRGIFGAQVDIGPSNPSIEDYRRERQSYFRRVELYEQGDGFPWRS